MAAPEQYAQELSAAVRQECRAIDVAALVAQHAPSLKNKVVVITGAASGFGRGVAIKVAAHGAKVVLSDLRLEAVQKVQAQITAAGGTATCIACDVTSWKDQRKLFEHATQVYGEIDVVVPNAGVTEALGWLDDTLDADGDLKEPNLVTLKTNLIGAMYTSKLAFHYFRKKSSTHKGAVVLIGSMSSFAAMPMGTIYTAAKHGVLGLFRSLKYDGEAEGITVNCVAPWFTDTGILTVGSRLLISGFPLCKVEDVVDSIVASASNPTYTGNALSVDSQGVFEIPFDAKPASIKGRSYYFDFAERGTYILSVGAFARDYAKLLKAIFRTAAGKSLAALLLAVAAVVVAKRR